MLHALMLQLRACVSVLCAQTNTLNKKLIRCKNKHCFRIDTKPNNFKSFVNKNLGITEDLVFCYKYNQTNSAHTD